MKIRLLFFSISSILFYVPELPAQEMGFEEYNPKSTLVVPVHKVSKSKFPFIDVHSHQRNMSPESLKGLITDMDALNEAVMVNLSGGSGSSLREQIENINQVYPNRFVVFANVDFDGVGTKGWTENAVAQLEADIKNGAKGLKVFKSLGLRNMDSDGNRLAVDDERIDAIWAKCAEMGVPVLIHSADPKSFWDDMDGDNERWLELKTHPRRKRSDTDPASWEQIIEEQHRMFKKHPNTKFINAHMGWYANDLGKLGQLLDEIPNMNVGIAAVIAELGRQPRNAREFFIKYQDRILFGKDSWQPEEFPTYFRVLETDDEYFPYYKKYHAFWAMYGLNLPDEVLKKVYYKNALKLIPGLDKSLFSKN
ncbi:Predicted metal-dependent hydrolase, TIM-barrel fold [Pricia antarctica]|uniref:Predicted metal-dependent hydrolase, TIM-barrel fold n=1 Tax=Pricia antarctica TaxID=641691 RepID=A0A1G7EXM0_9FLAO|nr:amidohydrolase family protein [Pricia antarctica]SDE68420.1 Predicted metal-dependent hydrolase, TIM-barrel fold [Pricia antarctica]